jgi:hypothetical protein
MSLMPSLLVTVTICGSIVGRSAQAGYSWPQVVPISRDYNFPDVDHAMVSLTLKDTQGKPLYWMGCHSGDFTGNSGDPFRDDEDYFGAFDCHLHSLHPRSEYNLLSYDAVWRIENFSRAATSAGDLWGACYDYPEWGRTRHIRLRGMRMTMQFNDVHFERTGISAEADEVLRSFRFTLRIEPDEKAVSAVAEPPPFANPLKEEPGSTTSISNGCTKIIPEHVPGVVPEDYIRQQGLQPPYPRVTRAVGTTTFAVDEPKDFRLSILDEVGNEAYSVQCSAGIGQNGLGQWGVVCELVQAGKRLDLLADGIDPYSRMPRGLIVPDQLIGKCSTYPEWGAVRHFRLRGLDLSLRINNLIQMRDPAQRSGVNSSRLTRFHLQASVQPDATATSAVALPAPYIDWRFLDRPNACGQVLVLQSASEKH